MIKKTTVLGFLVLGLVLSACASSYQQILAIHAQEQRQLYEEYERQQNETRAVHERQRREEQESIEQAQQAQAATQRADEYFRSYRYAEAIAEYEEALNVEDFRYADSIRRKLERTREFMAKRESYNRPLRDEDFEVRQNPDNTVTITKYNGAEMIDLGSDGLHLFGTRDVVIPARLYGLSVTVIGASAFRNMEITGVVVPSTVTEIEEYAFNNNLLESVTIGENVKIIGINAFSRTSGDREFVERSRSSSLIAIVIPNSVTEIGDGAFSGSGLTGVTLGRGVKTIGYGAFNSNQLRSIVIPDNVETIGGDAFSRNPMTEAVIPASLAGVQFRNATDRQNNRNPQPRLGALFGSNSFVSAFPDTLTRISLPASMHDVNLLGFEDSLRNFYISQNRVAGTYVKNGPVWSRE